MQHDHQHALVERGEFFRSLLYRNYFQYPPMRQLKPGAPPIPATSLGLDEPLAGEDFTIFISVPFCRVRCNSCPYFVAFLPAREDQETFLDRYVARLERQLRQYASVRRFAAGRCRAVYFGGGTASLLSPRQVAHLVRLLKERFPCAEDTEITLEGNPGDFTAEYLLAARKAGATRVSLGYQSSQETILRKTLNSPHTANESLRALVSTLAAGFDTANVDLLYRLPGQTFEQWQYDIDVILGYEPESVTMYEYVVHANTAAAQLMAKGRLGQQVDRQTTHAWYLWTREQMLAHGYEEPSHGHYSKPGHEQRYSGFTYGLGCELIGLGAKAYSYVNGYQFAAPNSVPNYARLVDAGAFPVMDKASPSPSPRNLMERFVIFSLRRASAVDDTIFRRRFGRTVGEVFPDEVALLTANGTLTVTAGGIELTALGKQWRNNVLDMFYSPDFK
jgi:oxygen-independent coproporphyrinogen-3 oxidase